MRGKPIETARTFQELLDRRVGSVSPKYKRQPSAVEAVIRT